MREMLIGEKLKKLRVAHQYSQMQIAMKLSVSRSLVSLWESNRRKPDYLDLIKLANIFCISLDSLTTSYVDEEVNNVLANALLVNIISEEALLNKDDTQIMGSIHIVSKVLKPKKLFGLKVSSECMNKVVVKGMIALFEECDCVSNDDIVVAALADEKIVIHRYFKLHNKVVLEPDSYDASYLPLVVEESKLRIIGRLVWCCMDMDEYYK